MDGKKSTVSLDTKITGKGGSDTLHCRMLSCYVDTISDLLLPHEIGLIKGRLRNGDLTGAVIPSVVSRLDTARQVGNMSVKDFARLYQFCSMFKKVPSKGLEALCKETGFNKLLAGEEACGLVNRTIEIRKGLDFPLFDRVKRIIWEILGDLPTDFLNTDVFFGPGSSVNVNKRSYAETGLFYKLSDKLVVPEKAVYYLAAHLSSQPNWVDSLGLHYRLQRNSDESRLSFEMRVFRRHFHVVPNDYPSRIGFVPKNSDEHRTIGVEMNGLMVLQKVVGNLIRKRLRDRTPINLDSQQRNKHLARLAKTFGLATIDLANASNSISLELVRALLPPDWFAVISDFRSDYGHCPSHKSEKIRYEMVSSMGNGFTFELESLIFYALAKACAERVGLHAIEIKRSVGVYGDDIIVPKTVAPTLIEGMSLFGFTTNVEKSFIQGFFFESCGADYYYGVDVRPFLIKRKISTIRDLFFVMNSLVYKAMRNMRSDLSDLYALLFKLIPDQSLMGPLHFDSKESHEFGLDKLDDLEAVLRVPLDVAQAYGAVRFDDRLFAWRYKKYVRVGLESPFSKSPDYFVKNIRYLTFLKGTLGGKVVLRGRTCDRLKSHTSSSWNGVLTVQQLRVASVFFRSL